MITSNRLLFRTGRCDRPRAWCAAIILASLLGLAVPLRAADAPTEGAAAEAPAAITTADVKGISTPSTDDLAKVILVEHLLARLPTSSWPMPKKGSRSSTS